MWGPLTVSAASSSSAWCRWTALSWGNRPCYQVAGKKDGVKRQEKRREVCGAQRGLLKFLLLPPLSFGVSTAFQDCCLSQVLQTDPGRPLGGMGLGGSGHDTCLPAPRMVSLPCRPVPSGCASCASSLCSCTQWTMGGRPRSCFGGRCTMKLFSSSRLTRR